MGEAHSRCGDEVLNMRLAAQLEFVLAKTQCVQQYLVIEYFRARQVGSCDVDVMIAITSVMALCVSG